MTTPSIFAIVPAAGIGSRMGADKPKQYLQLASQSVIEHTLSKLLKVAEIKKIIVCLSSDDGFFKTLACASDERIVMVEGGATRSESVSNGLNWLKVEGYCDSWALVHDAARPCVNPSRIKSLINQCITQNVGGILAVPMSNTLRRVTKESLGKTETVSRENIWAAHTPQLFRVSELLESLNVAASKNIEVTDEASAIEVTGGQVLMIEDETTNIKVTRPEDLAIASLILNAQQQELL